MLDDLNKMQVLPDGAQASGEDQQGTRCESLTVPLLCGARAPSQIPACMLAQRFFGIKENVLL